MGIECRSFDKSRKNSSKFVYIVAKQYYTLFILTNIFLEFQDLNIKVLTKAEKNRQSLFTLLLNKIKLHLLWRIFFRVLGFKYRSFDISRKNSGKFVYKRANHYKNPFDLTDFSCNFFTLKNRCFGRLEPLVATTGQVWFPSRMANIVAKLTCHPSPGSLSRLNPHDCTISRDEIQLPSTCTDPGEVELPIGPLQTGQHPWSNFVAWVEIANSTELPIWPFSLVEFWNWKFKM